MAPARHDPPGHVARTLPVVAVVALVVALVATGPAPAAVAQVGPPENGGSGGLKGSPPENGAIAAARAEAARLEREVARLDTEVEVLAEANAAPLALLLGARDTHELALAGGVAGRMLERDRQAVALTGLAAGTVRTRVAELGATQAEAVTLRRRLAGQAAAIGERLDRRRAVLVTARAEVRALVQAEWARREAVRRALVAAAALRARGFGLGVFADAPAPSPTAAAAARAALDQVGKPYRWGATGPEEFDCSGLVR